MKPLFVLAAAVAALSSSAQVSFSGPYSQNFDTLPPAGTNLAWTDNAMPGLVGWYSSLSTISADDGSSSADGRYSLGTTGSGERALGSHALPGAIHLYGARLQNTTSTAMTTLGVAYYGEQWRSGSAFADGLNFEYSTNATGLWSGTWTSVAALDFSAMNFSAAGAIDGNLPANRTFLSSTITGLSWAPGTDVWIRWTHIGNTSEHTLGIDDVKLQAGPVPEPFTMALAAAGLGLAARRRRRAG